MTTSFHPSPRRTDRQTAPARGFSLIELLVVIAIVGIAVSIMLPALGKARRSARALTELAAMQQVMTGYAAYADEHQGHVLPGYLPTAWVNPSPNPGAAAAWQVFDDTGEALYGVRAQRYPWRLAPYLDYNFGALYKDAHLLQRYRERADFQYIISVSPSFGLNADFVGGKALPGFGFNPAAQRQWGPFYVTRMDQARRPDALIVFASAHGVDPDGGAPVDGYYDISSPRFLDRRWTNAYTIDEPPGVHGNVHARYDGRAVIGCLDGHAAMEPPADFDDMRRWSNQATRADWTLGSR